MVAVVLDAVLESGFWGCCLDRPTQRWIEDVGGWAEGEGVWDTNGETEEHLFFYRAGRFVKAG